MGCSSYALIFAQLFVAQLLWAQTVSLLPPFPSDQKITCGEESAPAQVLAEGILLPVLFTNTFDRAYWDIPLGAAIPASATALDLFISSPDLAPVSGISLHLQSGKGWYGIPVTPTASARQRITLPKGLFQAEDTPSAWDKAHLLRLSVWRKTNGATSFTIHAVRARSDTIALIRATERMAPGEAAFAASLTDRCGRILAKADIPFAVIDDTLESLDAFSLLFLPYATTLPDRQMNRLERFFKRKGKLVVFYNTSQPLGALLGIQPGTWQGTPPGQEWSAMFCDTNRLPGAAARIPHTTNSVIPPFTTNAYNARTIAYWVDESGRQTDLPACTVSDRGAWFAHIPPIPYPSSVELFGALVRHLAPSAEPLPPTVSTPVRPSALPLPPDEIRAAWYTSATPRHPQGWNGLLRSLSQNGINTLFVHWQSAIALRHTGTHIRLPDNLDEALTAGRRNDVSVHAWATCWTLEGVPPEQIRRLEKEGRLMCDASGAPLPWLCPSIPENRTWIINGLRELVRSGAHGIHIDYVRYPDARGCYAPATRKAFESSTGVTVNAWPGDVLEGGPHARAYRKFRNDTITGFVREARNAIRSINPAIPFTAAVFPTPEAAARHGQDWATWVREGLVDAVCPMIYTEDPSVFATSLDACISAVPYPKTGIIPGIGTGADESQLDAQTTAIQIRHTRSRNLAGFAFFAVDDELTTRILPVLFRK